MNVLTVEICCGSADDAVNAFDAGADRVELNSALMVGGLTPSLGMLETVKSSCGGNVVCMARPRPGGFCYGELEFETMLRDVKLLADAGADGVAFGVLTEDGRIDEDRCARLVRAAYPAEAVFHRAFDAMSTDRLDGVDILARLGFKRILTSGGMPTAPEGAGTMAQCVLRACGKIEILAGGGVRPSNAKRLVKETGCTQLHFSFHKDISDMSTRSSAVRFNVASLPDEETVKVVDTENLKIFIRDIRGF